MPRSARPVAVFAFATAVFFSRCVCALAVPPGKWGQSPPPAASTDPANFVIAPYLQYPTQTSITIMWETAASGTSVVEFGITPGDMKKVEAKSAGTIHEVKITGLSAETNYVYRASSVLEDGTKVVGPLSQFQTAVKDDSAFSFAVIGDTQRNPRMTAKIARVIADRHPHFVIHVGDVVDNGPDKAQWVHDLFGPCTDLFSHCAVFPAIGNHEKNHAWYYRYFSLPDPEYRYRYRYGNADFFVVDSNKSLKPGSEQYKWLDQELGRSSARWKFVYHHHPTWSSDADDYGNTKKGIFRYGDLNVRNLVALYEKHKVERRVQRAHSCLRADVSASRWQGESPEWDCLRHERRRRRRLEDFGALPTWFKAQLRVDFHCCYVTIHAGRLEFKAFDQNGQLFDQFEIDK